jgi:hypothetical protein
MEGQGDGIIHQNKEDRLSPPSISVLESSPQAEQESTPGIFSPVQAAALYEWNHLTRGHDLEGGLKPWSQVEADFRNDELIRQMDEWKLRFLTEEEFWSLVYYRSEGPQTAQLYDGQDSRLLRNIAQKFGSLDDSVRTSYLQQVGSLNLARNSLAAPYEDPVIVRATIGEDEKREAGSFYIHDGNRRLLGIAEDLVTNGGPYVPILALVGEKGEPPQEADTELKSKGSLEVKGYKDREPIPQHEILETFKNADHLYFNLPPKIGDIVVGTGFLHGIHELERSLGLSPRQKTIIAPVSMHALLRPTCEALGIRLIKGGDINASQNRAEYQAREIDQQKAVIFEMDSTGGGDPEGLYFGEGQLTIKNLLPSLLDRYTIDEAGPNRQRQYLADLFGVDVKALDPRNCQPKLEMTDTSDTVVKQLIEQYGIDPEKPQVAINIETSEAGRQYRLENWCEVAKILKRHYPNMELNISFAN